ncbi:FlgO family outer membrane protein [Geotalea sp. SG265]|uniref:FlgO family outer membrane protein n=1 Tax=Geotalea sp. SG265 TaxID=2922867 RepID=UPI001FAF9364|nr:FlgO family outer membrane protein [Geotalea sp. SG265]
MRRRIIICWSAFILSWMLTGCAGSLASNLVGGTCQNKPLPVLLDSTDLRALFEEIAAELCTDTCSDCSPSGMADKKAPRTCLNRADAGRTTVLVTDFADIQTFLPSQSGLLMGELMRAGLNNVCCHRIVQAEFGKYFKLSENGLVVLTRKLSEIKKDEYSRSDVVVGTYNYMNNGKIVLFVRKMNTETGTISRMVTKEIDYSCTGRNVVGYSIK